MRNDDKDRGVLEISFEIYTWSIDSRCPKLNNTDITCVRVQRACLLLMYLYTDDITSAFNSIDLVRAFSHSSFRRLNSHMYMYLRIEIESRRQVRG